MFVKFFIIITIFFSVLSLFFVKTQTFSSTQTAIMTENDKIPLNIELATTNRQWSKGLSGKLDLCSNCGMLFIFPNAEPRTFVMREMNFPIDIIWLNNKKIISYYENLQPEASEPYTPYNSFEPVDMVLEMPAGFMKYYKVKIGDSLIYEQN